MATKYKQDKDTKTVRFEISKKDWERFDKVLDRHGLKLQHTSQQVFLNAMNKLVVRLEGSVNGIINDIIDDDHPKLFSADNINCDEIRKTIDNDKLLKDLGCGFAPDKTDYDKLLKDKDKDKNNI